MDSDHIMAGAVNKALGRLSSPRVGAERATLALVQAAMMAHPSDEVRAEVALMEGILATIWAATRHAEDLQFTLVARDGSRVDPRDATSPAAMARDLLAAGASLGDEPGGPSSATVAFVERWARVDHKDSLEAVLCAFRTAASIAAGCAHERN